MITADILANWCKVEAEKEKQRVRRVERVPMYSKKIMLNVKAGAFAVSLDRYWSWYSEAETKLNKANVIQAATELIESGCNIQNQAKMSKMDAHLLFLHGYDKDVRKLRKQTKSIERVLYDIQTEESTMIRIGKLFAILEIIGVTVDEIDASICGKGRRLYANTKAVVS